MGKKDNIRRYPDESVFARIFERPEKQSTGRYSKRIQDFSSWYSPMIERLNGLEPKHPGKLLDNFEKSNFVAIIYGNSKVLDWHKPEHKVRIPDIQSLEFKFKYLGGIDTMPICLNPRTIDELVQAVLWLECKCGAVCLKCIESPMCFQIMDVLDEESNIPVWHDDHQSAAVLNLAGLINALRLAKKDIDNVKVSFIGTSKENIATLNLMVAAGLSPSNVCICGEDGILCPGSQCIDEENPLYKYKDITNKDGRIGRIPEAIKGTDVCISDFIPGPDTIKPEWISFMADNPILFVCAEPYPETWPWDAKKAGAAIVATRHANLPNYLDNSIVYPGLFRGALDVGASRITKEMCISAAQEIADFTSNLGISADYILPTAGDWEIFARVATEVGTTAIEQNIAANHLTQPEIYFRAKDSILEARKNLEHLIKEEKIRKAA